jgi:hypothetical protein
MADIQRQYPITGAGWALLTLHVTKLSQTFSHALMAGVCDQMEETMGTQL